MKQQTRDIILVNAISAALAILLLGGIILVAVIW